MGQVVVKVNGRDFTLSCEDGQEARIRRLAQYVDAKVAEFVTNIGQAGEARLILLAALVIADELSDANDACSGSAAAAQVQAAAVEAAAPNASAASTQRIESIAARLEPPSYRTGWGCAARQAA